MIADRQSEFAFAEMRTALAQARDSLRAQLATLRQQLEPTDFTEVIGDQSDMSAARTEWEREFIEEHNLRDKLMEVEHALTKLDVGTYGRCEACGQPIPLARLKILPWARYDVEHQAAFERHVTPFVPNADTAIVD